MSVLSLLKRSEERMTCECWEKLDENEKKWWKLCIGLSIGLSALALVIVIIILIILGATGVIKS